VGRNDDSRRRDPERPIGDHREGHRARGSALSEFSYNPKDARFIGSPVDLVVLDGLDREALEQIVPSK
jgi:hypothetical protein